MDPFDRARVRLWVDHIAKNIIGAFHRLVQAQEPEKQQAYLGEFNKALRTLADQIKGPYFLGDEFSLVDIAVAPWIVRDYIVAQHRAFSRHGVGGGWKEYAERVESRDSVVKTSSVSAFDCCPFVPFSDGGLQDKIHYEEIYGRYLRDEAQSEVAKAIRAGRALP